MTFINPGNSPTTTLTFTVASGASTTDALGNSVPGSGTVTADVVITELGRDKLAQIQASLGSDRVGIPVKLRVNSSNGQYPSGIPRGKTVEASCTYAGAPATVAMMIGGTRGAVVGLGLLPSLGHSVDGLLSFDN